MRFVVLRKHCLLNILVFLGMLICFFVSFVNYFDQNAKLIPSIAGTVALFIFSFLWLWMITRNYLQIFSLKKEGIYTHKGFKRYLHFDYKNIEQIKVITFDSPPVFKKGTKIIGIDSSLSAPKNPPQKWIVISDSRKDNNLCNYNSYLVPIRSHMVIKLEYSEKREKMLIDYVNCNIEYQTISFEEMKKGTPEIKAP